jgi:hypothetical protein
MDLKFKIAHLVFWILRVIHRGGRERRDFSPTPLSGVGRPEGKNLRALVALWG